MPFSLLYIPFTDKTVDRMWMWLDTVKAKVDRRQIIHYITLQGRLAMDRWMRMWMWIDFVLFWRLRWIVDGTSHPLSIVFCSGKAFCTKKILIAFVFYLFLLPLVLCTFSLSIFTDPCWFFYLSCEVVKFVYLLMDDSHVMHILLVHLFCRMSFWASFISGTEKKLVSIIKSWTTCEIFKMLSLRLAALHQFT